MALLAAPARFTPWENGIYSVSPGLRVLGTDFGNGEADSKIFLIDSDFPRYRTNKEVCTISARSRHWLSEGLDEGIAAQVFSLIARRLAAEYPNLIQWSGSVLSSALTNERIALDSRGQMGVGSRVFSGVCDVLEALAMQVQCDLAIIRKVDGEDRVLALHVCAPSSWSPAEKIGKSFFATHTPVPGFERVNAVAPKMVDALIEQGPFVRFVWGVSSDDELNHHPDLLEERGRFDRGRFYVRLERQTTLGLPEIDAAAFFIHVQTVPDTWILEREGLRQALARGLHSMSPEARSYKSVQNHFDELMSLLERKPDLQ